jgi:hypothetical protein
MHCLLISSDAMEPTTSALIGALYSGPVHSCELTSQALNELALHTTKAWTNHHLQQASSRALQEATPKQATWQPCCLMGWPALVCWCQRRETQPAHQQHPAPSADPHVAPGYIAPHASQVPGMLSRQGGNPLGCPRAEKRCMEGAGQLDR